MSNLPYSIVSKLITNTWAQVENEGLVSTNYLLIKDSIVDINMDSGLLPVVKAITADSVNFTVSPDGNALFSEITDANIYVNSMSSALLFQKLLELIESNNNKNSDKVIHFKAIHDTGESFTADINLNDMNATPVSSAKDAPVIISCLIPGTMGVYMLSLQPSGIYFLTNTVNTYHVVKIAIYSPQNP